jgi:glycerate dehydrogenase
MTSITVLDGFTLNPGDLSWDALKAIAPCEIFDRTSAEQIIARAKNAEIVLTNKTPLSKATIDSLPKLKYIGVLATGYNVVDIQAAKEKNIPVCNVPGYSGMSVSQAVFSLLIEITNQVGRHSQEVRNGKWSSSPDFCFTSTPIIELADLTFGVVGYGNIAQNTIKIAQAMGMKILVHTRTIPAEIPKGVSFVTLESLLKNSDVISLHCPLTDQTKNMINKTSIESMKRTAILINTGRGPLIDEEALATALNTDRIFGAGLDVLSQEPPLPSNPLLSAKNCIITPHNAWASKAARERLMNMAIENLKAYLNNKPTNRVN